MSLTRLIFLALVGYIGYSYYKQSAANSATDGADTGSLFYFSTGKTFMGQAQTLSANGLERLKQRESFSSTRYEDPKGSGKYSIGFGHQIKAGESLDNISIDVGSQLLALDVASAEDTVNSNISADISQNAFDALVSFVYNVGKTAFEGGTVPEKINNGDMTGATQTMLLYKKAGGNVSVALIARRTSEVAQFYA